MSAAGRGKVGSFFYYVSRPQIVWQSKPSEAAQLRLIASGKAPPAARSRAGSKRAIAEEQELQQEDDVVLHDVEPEPEHFVFVDDDDEGALATPTKTAVADSTPTRKRKLFKTGTNSKNTDLEVVDTYGAQYKTADGAVKINLAKLILRPVTEAEIEAKKHLDGKGKLIGAGCWRCLLPRLQSPSHHEFVRIGQNTGNLMQHCQQYHEPVLDGLERIIAETPKTEAKFACEQYIKNIPPPSGAGSLTRMLGKDSSQISNELLCLVWFLDANIAFAQFDNPLFHQLIRDLGGRQFPSSSTVVERVLPVLFRYAVEHMVGWLKRCRSFFTSFDGWSKFGERFVSQSYHCIQCRLSIAFWRLILFICRRRTGVKCLLELCRSARSAGVLA